MKARVEAIINPELLIWARESAGLDLEIAAKKAQVKPENLKKWENEESRPTINQLRKLSNVYKRPFAVFYLPKPPKKISVPKDFRKFPSGETKKISPNLLYEIRKTKNRRLIALDLYNLIGETPPKIDFSLSINDHPENAAIKLREILGISYLIQFSWSTYYEAFIHWRQAFENIGVFVFQSSRINLTEMRGFSISDTPLPVIVINNKDTYTGKIFSMLHEFVHVLLKKDGICDLSEEGGQSYNDQLIEIYCNRLAGASLVPREYLLKESIITKNIYRKSFDDKEISSLASKYKVSPEVMLRRLLTVGIISKNIYLSKRDYFHEKFKERDVKNKKDVHIPVYIRTLSSLGTKFPRLVLYSYYQEKITSSDISEYLDIRLKHMPNIEFALMKQPILFRANK